MPLFSIPHGGAAAAGYVIGHSCRFNDNDSPQLNQTFSGASDDPQKMTFSMWIKRANVGANICIFAGSAGGDVFRFQGTTTTDALSFVATATANYKTTPKHRDPTAWFHLVFAIDTTLATANDRGKIYINGVLTEDYTTRTTFSLNQNVGKLLQADANVIGHNSGSQYFDGYLAEFIAIDGTTYAATDFGEFDTNGNWVPIDPSGLTFGTNGYWLDFADSSDIGNNANSTDGTNDWSPVNLVAGDITTDSPTDDADNSVGNYATLNPLSAEGAVTFSEGNLKIAGKSASYSMYLSTLPIKVKTYFEVTNNGDSSANGVRGSAGDD